MLPNCAHLNAFIKTLKFMKTWNVLHIYEIHIGWTMFYLRMFVPTLKTSQNLQMWQVLECNKKDIQVKSGSLNIFSCGLKYHTGIQRTIIQLMCLQEGVLITFIKVVWQFWCKTFLLGITIIFRVSILKKTKQVHNLHHVINIFTFN